MATGIILGTVQFGMSYGINNSKGKPDLAVVDSILEEAFRLGIRCLDTAEAYGNAQEIVGYFHAKQNNFFAVNTKFIGLSKKEHRTKLNNALQLLCVNQINTYFYHSFKDYQCNPDLLDELKKLKVDKLIQNIGISVYTNEHFDIAINDPYIDVIQLPFNLLDNFSRRGTLISKAKKANKMIQVRSVFLQGLFFKELNALPAFLLPLKPYLLQIHSLMQETGISMESLCLQYANAQQEIDEMIIGVDTREQLVNNMNVLNIALDNKIVDAVNNIHVKETKLLYPYNWK